MNPLKIDTNNRALAIRISSMTTGSMFGDGEVVEQMIFCHMNTRSHAIVLIFLCKAVWEEKPKTNN